MLQKKADLWRQPHEAARNMNEINRRSDAGGTAGWQIQFGRMGKKVRPIGCSHPCVGGVRRCAESEFACQHNEDTARNVVAMDQDLSGRGMHARDALVSSQRSKPRCKLLVSIDLVDRNWLVAGGSDVSHITHVTLLRHRPSCGIGRRLEGQGCGPEVF
jgi:hypothetical protein